MEKKTFAIVVGVKSFKHDLQKKILLSRRIIMLCEKYVNPA